MIFSLHNVYRTYCRWREFCQEASDKCISYQYIYVSKIKWIQFIFIRSYYISFDEFLNQFLYPDFIQTLRVSIMIHGIFFRSRKITKITILSYFNVWEWFMADGYRIIIAYINYINFIVAHLWIILRDTSGQWGIPSSEIEFLLFPHFHLFHLFTTFQRLG